MGAIKQLEPSGSNGAIQLQRDGELDWSEGLFFDITNSRLGVGTLVPSSSLHVAGNITVDGNINATEYHTTVVSSSIIYQSGSTKFGDTADDIHDFTGHAVFNTGLSGSLTTLADGSPFMNAGVGILVSTGSDGSVTVESTYSTQPGDDGVVQLQNNNTLSGSNDLFFDSENSRLGIGTTVPSSSLHVAGDVVVDGKVTATEFHSTVVSSSIIYQSGSTLFGDTTDDIHEFNGQSLFNNGLSGSLTTLVDGTSYLVGGDGVTITSASNGSVTITSPATIGSAEDDSYTDGLFSDFTSSTPTGTAIDRFNEILKSLAPSPAPQVTNIDCNQSGQSCRLSYDSSNILSTYAPVGTSTGFPTTSVNDIFQSATSGTSVRKGVFNSSSTITGDVNESTSSDIHSSGETNYPNNAFGDANKGSLKLEINGTTVHSMELNDLFLGSGQPGGGTDQSKNSNGSGFKNISELATASFSDGTSLDLFQHRTAKYTVDPSDQRNGWNILKVIHEIDGVSQTTNSVEWLVDSNSDEMALTTSSLSSLSMLGSHTISGVAYHIGGTAQYSVNVQNAYNNVYTSDSNITFNSSNCSVDLVPVPQIDITGGEDETKEITVTTEAEINQNVLFNGTISVAINVNHPTKNNIYGGAQEIISGLLVYNLSDSSTNLSENFSGEDLRLEAGEYVVQGHVTNVSNSWNSYESLNDKNGMIVYDQKLMAPRASINNGNFTTMINGPLSNVDYSSITTGTRTYYRKVQNTSGGSQTDLSIVINGSGTIMQHGSSYGTTGVSISAKIPTTTNSQTTGWLDLSQPFATGQYSTGDGCLQGTLDSSLNASNVMTFGTRFLNDDEYIVLKIECDAAFTGHIDSITVNWG
jgi:hypothetical protein